MVNPGLNSPDPRINNPFAESSDIAGLVYDAGWKIGQQENALLILNGVISLETLVTDLPSDPVLGNRSQLLDKVVKNQAPTMHRDAIAYAGALTMAYLAQGGMYTPDHNQISVLKQAIEDGAGQSMGVTGIFKRELDARAFELGFETAMDLRQYAAEANIGSGPSWFSMHKQKRHLRKNKSQ